LNTFYCFSNCYMHVQIWAGFNNQELELSVNPKVVDKLFYIDTTDVFVDS